MIKKQEQSRMADYLTGHRKIKDQFFSQLSVLLDWEKLEKKLTRYLSVTYSESTTLQNTGSEKDNPKI